MFKWNYSDCDTFTIITENTKLKMLRPFYEIAECNQKFC